ncbi:MAG: hypothetical protein AAF989_03460 [Planctomycetota bacterium]
MMVQRPAPNAGARELFESLVGQLIGRAGFDLILVDPPHRWSLESTDRLTIESLQGDLAALDWQDAGEMQNELKQFLPKLRRCPHEGDRDAAAPRMGDQRLYAVNLSNFAASDNVLRVLDGILESRQTKTFGLTNPSIKGAAGTGGSPTIAQPLSGGPSKPTPDLPSDSVSKPSASAGPKPPLPSTNAHRPNGPQLSPGPSLELDLDDLVDQLDDLDP